MKKIVFTIVSIVWVILFSCSHSTAKFTVSDQKLAQLEANYLQFPQSAEITKNLGIAYFERAIDKPGEYAEKAVKFLNESLAQNYGDDECLAFLGAATARLTQLTKDPFQIMKYSGLSTSILNLAKNRAPENLLVRITSARCLMRFPSFMGKTESAKEDFEYALKLVEKTTLADAGDWKKEIYPNLLELSKRSHNSADEIKYTALVKSLDKVGTP